MSAVPEPFASIAAVALGLIMGSFLNVCIHRLPLGQSVVAPRSRCPGCGSTIRWFENIPVVSWLALGGRCSRCRARISIRYPAVELLGGLSLWALWSAFGLDPRFPIGAFFVLAMIALFFTDLDHRLLPDAITLGGLAVGLLVAWVNPFLAGEGLGRVWDAATGAALGAGLLWGFGAVYGRLRGVEAMGLGDVKMMAMIGAFAGPPAVLLTIFAGSVLGAVLGLTRVALRGGTLQDTLPFGCFLAPAAIAALFYARTLWAAYMRLVIPMG